MEIIIQKTSRSLWKYSRDEPNLDDNGNINDFPNNTDSASFKFKQKITGQTRNYGTKGVEIIVPFKYISNFWRTLELSLFNCEINLFLPWSAIFLIVILTANNQETTFAITNTKLYIPVVILSNEDKAKLSQQSKTDLKKQLIEININQNQQYRFETNI